MKVLSVVHWSGASPRTGRLKSAHAAHGLGGATHLPSKPPHTLIRKGVVSSLDFQVNLEEGISVVPPGLSVSDQASPLIGC